MAWGPSSRYSPDRSRPGQCIRTFAGAACLDRLPTAGVPADGWLVEGMVMGFVTIGAALERR